MSDTKAEDPINPFEYDSGGISGKIKVRGLTKREYFAIKIMEGVESAGIETDKPHNMSNAEYSVEQADALIKELNK